MGNCLLVFTCGLIIQITSISFCSAISDFFRSITSVIFFSFAPSLYASNIAISSRDPETIYGEFFGEIFDIFSQFCFANAIGLLFFSRIISLFLFSILKMSVCSCATCSFPSLSYQIGI